MKSDSSAKVRSWHLGPVELTLSETRGILELEERGPDSDALSCLAKIGLPGVSLCALELIFQWGQEFAGLIDALRAYSERPLKDPPPQYLQAFNKVDWSVDMPPEQHKAIILAGSAKESDRLLLLKLLDHLAEDFRDGALFAASTFDELRFVEAVSRAAMSTSEQSAFATGEIWAFLSCYKRWIERNVVDMPTLDRLLRSLESKSPRLMRAGRLLNHIVCPRWDRIPHPETLAQSQPNSSC